MLVVLGLGLLAGGPAVRAQIAELPRPDSLGLASFGVSVALGDSLAVVGASGAATCGPNAGAVFVYERVPGPTFDDWRRAARLTPCRCRPHTFFGETVALSGSRLLVSASSGPTAADAGPNAAYVFERSEAGTWRQTARFVPPPEAADGAFAADVDLDGDRAVVTAPGDGDAGLAGAVYVYTHTPATGRWARTARLTPARAATGHVLGRSVALSGDVIAVSTTSGTGAPGGVAIFEARPAAPAWTETAFFSDVASSFIELDLDESVLLVGEDKAGPQASGRARLFARTRDGRWTERTTLRPAHPYTSGAFGTSVALDGPWALVTGYGEQLGKDFNIDRVVYPFRRRGGPSWTERPLLDIGQVDFGAALALHGAQALVSSVPDDAPGQVYWVMLR
jgi:hypothetical protein